MAAVSTLPNRSEDIAIVIIKADIKKLVPDEDDLRGELERITRNLFTYSTIDDKEKQRRLAEQTIKIWIKNGKLTQGQGKWLRNRIIKDVFILVRLAGLQKLAYESKKGTEAQKNYAKDMIKRFNIKNSLLFEKVEIAFRKQFNKAIRKMGLLIRKIKFYSARYPDKIGFTGNPRIVNVVKFSSSGIGKITSNIVYGAKTEEARRLMKYGKYNFRGW